MKFKKHAFLFIAVALIFSSKSWSDTGENTYKSVCATCHTPGIASAPKLGDKAKWSTLIKEGQVQITAHGYVGIRGMPAKGGKPDLGIKDFAASVVFMANQAGAGWQNPDEAMMKKIEAEIQRRQAQLRK